MRQDEEDQEDNSNLDQDLITTEPPEQTTNRQIEHRRDRTPEREPEPPTREDNPAVEIEFNDFRPLTVFHSHKKNSFYRLRAMKVGWYYLSEQNNMNKQRE